MAARAARMRAWPSHLGVHAALVLAVGVALLLGFALIGTSRLGAETDPPHVQERAATTPASPLLDGIPQDGTVLGRPDAR